MALSGEVLSPIRFWIDLLSHRCLPTSFIYAEVINEEMKVSENPIWRVCKSWLDSAPTDTNRHCITLSNWSVQLGKHRMPQKIQSLSFAEWHTTKRIMFAASAVSLHPFQTVSSSSVPLNNLFLLAPMAYFPHYWKGIKTQVISFGRAFNREGYYHISNKRMIVHWYIQVLFCL